VNAEEKTDFTPTYLTPGPSPINGEGSISPPPPSRGRKEGGYGIGLKLIHMGIVRVRP